MMYLRILAIIAVFNWSLAASLTPSLLALSLLGFALAGLHARMEPWPRDLDFGIKRQPASRECPQSSRCVDDDGLECDHGSCSARHGSIARHFQVPDPLDRAVG